MALQDETSVENKAAAPSATGGQPVTGSVPSGSEGVRLAQAAGETIPAPGPGERVVVEPGEIPCFAITSLEGAKVEAQDGGLLVTLPDGGEIFLLNVPPGAAGELPVLCLADGSFVALGQLVEIAGVSLADILPGLGPEPVHGGGAGFRPPEQVDPEFVPGPDPLPPTALFRGPPELQPLTLGEEGPAPPAPTAGTAAGVVVEDELVPDGSGNDPASPPLTTSVSGTVAFTDGTITDLSYDGALGPATQTGLTWTADDGSWTMTITDPATGAFTFELLGALDHPLPGLVFGDDTLSGVFTATISGPGGTTTGDITITVHDDGPSISASAAAADVLQVDETVLATDATVNFSSLFTSAFGADDAGTLLFSLGISASGADSGLVDTATGNSVFLFLESGVVVGREGTDAVNALTGDVVFTVSVDGSTGAVTLDQQRAVIHPDGTDPDDEVSLGAANLVTLTGTITDADGDSQSATVDLGAAISFKDDGPVNISPDPAVIGSNSVFPVIVTEDLDFFDNVGADRPGDVVFDPALQDAQLFEKNGGPAVTSNGQIIFLDISPDGRTLTGLADADGDVTTTGDQTTVFTIVLNPNSSDEGADDYTITLFDKVDTGASEVFSEFDQVASGNNLWAGVSGENVDILLTAGNVTSTSEVNTSGQGFGVENNLINPLEGAARIDFVTNLDLNRLDNPGPPSANNFFGNLSFVDFDQHFTVNGGSIKVSGLTGSGSPDKEVDVKITAYDADDNPTILPTDPLDYTDDPKDPIIHTDIIIRDAANAVVAGVIFLSTGAAAPTAGEVAVRLEADGSITVFNIQQDWSITNINTADGFNRLEVENVDTTINNFRITEVGFDTFQIGEAIDMEFLVDVTDEDGDTATGTIDVTVLPQQVADPGGETLTATEFGSDLLGQGGNDTLIGSDAADKLQGAGGDDTISDGAGTDIIIGGDGADIISLAADNETDVLIYDAISEAGDTVNGFDVDDPTVGGDIIDLTDLLDSGTFTGTTLSEAIAGGFVQVVDSGGNAEVNVDLDGIANGVSFTTIVTVSGVTASLIDDNIVVD